MSIFTKNVFFRDVPYWGNPRTTKRYFFQKSFTSKDSQVSLEDFRRHLNYYRGLRNFDPFYFLGGEISKQAACFDICHIIIKYHNKNATVRVILTLTSICKYVLNVVLQYHSQSIKTYPYHTNNFS